MIYISANIGSYSIKFLNYTIEKKKVVYLSSREVVIDSDEFNVTEKDVVTDLQFNIISQYLSEVDFEYRLILNAPNELLTERFLNLPVANKKKASLMIPFQLEEDIPYSLNDSHIGYSIKPQKDKSIALVNLAKDEEFDAFFKKMNQYKVVPSILTSEISAIENFISHTEQLLPQVFCVLDIGHNTTNAYFFLNKELKTVHSSYIAGFTINEAICDAYSISDEEATIYKHQNCFFLTQDQYSKVDEAQQTFANLMDKTFEPLIQEFKRWHIGFRVKNGLPVTDVFIIGGSSNIRNISSYLSEQFVIPVRTVDSFSDSDAKMIDTDEKQRRKFSMANIIAQAYLNKSNIINFLYGPYSIRGKMDLPLQSFTFIATRALILMLIVSTSLMIEKLYLNADIKAANKRLSALVKNSTLALNPREQREYKKDPQTTLSKLKREQRKLEQEVKLLNKSLSINALKPLEVISSFISGFDVEVISYQATDSDNFAMQLQVKDSQILTKIDEIFKSTTASNLLNITTVTNSTKNILTISGSEK